jgi:hypothetical protein
MPVPKGRLKIAESSPGRQSRVGRGDLSSPEETAENSQDVPGFPVGVGGGNEPHAAFRKESRTRRYVQSRVQEIRGSPGGPPFRSRKIKKVTSAEDVPSTDCYFVVTVPLGVVPKGSDYRVPANNEMRGTLTCFSRLRVCAMS